MHDAIRRSRVQLVSRPTALALVQDVDLLAKLVDET
jgi:hypothetical protein